MLPSSTVGNPALTHLRGGASVINCWWPCHKDLGCNMLQPNSALSIPVRVQIGEKCFCQKKLRATHQQWIAEAPTRNSRVRLRARQVNYLLAMGWSLLLLNLCSAALSFPSQPDVEGSSR